MKKINIIFLLLSLFLLVGCQKDTSPAFNKPVVEREPVSSPVIKEDLVSINTPLGELRFYMKEMYDITKPKVAHLSANEQRLEYLKVAQDVANYLDYTSAEDVNSLIIAFFDRTVNKEIHTYRDQHVRAMESYAITKIGQKHYAAAKDLVGEKTYHLYQYLVLSAGLIRHTYEQNNSNDIELIYSSIDDHLDRTRLFD